MHGQLQHLNYFIFPLCQRYYKSQYIFSNPHVKEPTKLRQLFFYLFQNAYTPYY